MLGAANNGRTTTARQVLESATLPDQRASGIFDITVSITLYFPQTEAQQNNQADRLLWPALVEERLLHIYIDGPDGPTPTWESANPAARTLSIILPGGSIRRWRQALRWGEA